MQSRNDNEKKENDTTKKSTTMLGQIGSLFFGGTVGSIAYNVYHAINNNDPEPNAPTPKK